MRLRSTWRGERDRRRNRNHFNVFIVEELARIIRVFKAKVEFSYWDSEVDNSVLVQFTSKVFGVRVGTVSFLSVFWSWSKVDFRSRRKVCSLPRKLDWSLDIWNHVKNWIIGIGVWRRNSRRTQLQVGRYHIQRNFWVIIHFSVGAFDAEGVLSRPSSNVDGQSSTEFSGKAGVRSIRAVWIVNGCENHLCSRLERCPLSTNFDFGRNVRVDWLGRVVGFRSRGRSSGWRNGNCRRNDF